MAATAARRAALTIWQHLPDGSGGCTRCGPDTTGLMGCVASSTAVLAPCPADFVGCSCAGADPSHWPVPADDEHVRIVSSRSPVALPPPDVPDPVDDDGRGY